jgi:hypothetical protein
MATTRRLVLLSCAFGWVLLLPAGAGGQTSKPASDEANLPDALYPEFPGPNIVSIHAERKRQKGRVDVTWTVERKGIKALRGFAVYRGKPAWPLGEPVARVGLVFAKPVDDGRLLRLSYHDLKAGNDAVKYAVAPISRAGDVGPLSKRAFAHKRRAKLAAPTDTACAVRDDGVLVTWNHAHPLGSTFAGFQILRSRPGSTLATEPALDGPLSRFRRAWLDRTVLKTRPGQKVAYRVVALSGDERIDARGGACTVTVPLPPPKPPRDLKARVKLDGEQYALTCEWTAPNMPGLAAFSVDRLDPHRGKWFHVGTARASPLKATIPRHVPGPTLTLRCTAVLRDGQRSAPGEEFVLPLPGKRQPLPPVSGSLNVRDVEGGRQFWWIQGPDERIVGYRLAADGNVLADEEALGPLTRRWTHRGDDPDGREVALLAVLADGEAVEIARRAAEGDGGEPNRAPKVMTREAFHDDARTKRSLEEQYYLDEHKRRVRHGVYRVWYADGRLKHAGHYEHGKTHGLFVWYTPDGRVRSASLYVRGEPVADLGRYQELFGKPLPEKVRAWYQQRRK